MDALPDNVSQNNFITLRNPVAVNSKFAQHQADSLRRQVGFFVPPFQKSVDCLCQLTNKEMCRVCFVAESECGFGHHALRIEEPSPGSLPALPQDFFKHRLAQLPAVEDRGKPGQGLITHFRNERATVNLAVTHSFVMDHAVAQQPRLKALSNDLFFQISQKG